MKNSPRNIPNAKVMKKAATGFIQASNINIHKPTNPSEKQTTIEILKLSIFSGILAVITAFFMGVEI